MRRALPRIALLLATAVLGLSSVPAAALGSTPSSSKAILIIATGLSWSDVTATGTPTLYHLAETGAIANLNAHPKVAESHEPPSALEGALDISAGNWATPEFTAEGAYGAAERVDGSTGAEVFRRTTGASMGSAAVAYLGLPLAVRTTTSAVNEMVLGTLGSAITDAGGSTVAIGNSDAGDTAETWKVERPAAVAGMNEIGLVTYGDVSRNLLATDSVAPYGVRTDLSAFEGALVSAEASVSEHGGPSLVVLDPGDSYRATRFAQQAADAVATRVHVDALRTLDAVVAMALNHASASDVVIVAGEAPGYDSASGQQGFSPLLVSAADLHGLLTSSSTHRSGMVANPDITAAVLSRLGLATPVQVIGNPLSAKADPDDAKTRIDRLALVNSTVTAVDSMRAEYITTLVHFLAVLLLLVAAFVAFSRYLPERWTRPTRAILMALCLAVVSFVTGGWAMFLFHPTYATPDGAALGLWLSSLLLVAVASGTWWFTRSRLAPAALLLATAALLAVDQFVGAPISVANLLGYSPLQASRYYGIGNEASAFMIACAVIGSALLVDEWPEAGWSLAYRRFGIPLVGALVVIASAAPDFGANVGVAIWGTAGVLVAWAGMNGRRLTWKLVVAGVLVVVILISGFALIDVFGGGAQTHLARSLSTAQKGGAAQLSLIVERKAAGNARILFGVGWWFVALGASLTFLAFLRIWSARAARAVLAENPAFASAVAAVLIAGGVAFFTEDTGILIVTVMSIPLSAIAAWLVLAAYTSREAGA